MELSHATHIYTHFNDSLLIIEIEAMTQIDLKLHLLMAWNARHIIAIR